MALGHLLVDLRSIESSAWRLRDEIGHAPLRSRRAPCAVARASSRARASDLRRRDAASAQSRSGKVLRAHHLQRVHFSRRAERACLARGRSRACRRARSHSGSTRLRRRICGESASRTDCSPAAAMTARLRRRSRSSLRRRSCADLISTGYDTERLDRGSSVRSCACRSRRRTRRRWRRRRRHWSPRRRVYRCPPAFALTASFRRFERVRQALWLRRVLCASRLLPALSVARRARERALIGLGRELAREQKVARVALGNLDDVALLAERLNVGREE